MSKVSDEDVPDIKTGLFRNTCSWLAVSPVITRSKCSFSCNLRTEAWSRGGYFRPRVAARNGIPHRVPFRLPLADLLS